MDGFWQQAPMTSGRSDEPMPPFPYDSSGHAVTVGRAQALPAPADPIDTDGELNLQGCASDQIPDQIRHHMSMNLPRVMDVLRSMDDDGNGLIDRKEFSNAMREMGYDAPESALRAVFKSMDVNGSKAVDYSQMRWLLDASCRNFPHLQPLPPPALRSHSTRRSRLNKRESTLLQGIHVDESGLATLPDRLRQHMKLKFERVIETLRKFDDDGMLLPFQSSAYHVPRLILLLVLLCCAHECLGVLHMSALISAHDCLGVLHLP